MATHADEDQAAEELTALPGAHSDSRAHSKAHISSVLAWAARNTAAAPAGAAAAAIAFALGQLGKPYQWGAAGPDADRQMIKGLAAADGDQALHLLLLK